MVVKKRKIVKTETIIKEDKPKVIVEKPKTIIVEKKVKATKKRRRRKTSSAPKKSQSDIQVEKLLIENFVSLQKVMTSMTIKFDNLASQMSKLLELFEVSAKSMAEKGFATNEDKKVLEKLDSLLEQNKTFAKGIALLHEKEKREPEVIETPQRVLPRAPMYPSAMPAVKKIVKTEYHEPLTPNLSENPSFEEGM